MRQQPVLSGAARGTAPASGAARKPQIRTRLSPAGADGTRSGSGSPAGTPPPARLSPVLRASSPVAVDGGCASAAVAGAATRACTPPAMDLPAPSNQILVRALMKRGKAAPVVGQPLHPSPLPPVGGTLRRQPVPLNEEEEKRDGAQQATCAAACTREKRERLIVSAGSTSSTATMPSHKRRTTDTSAAGGAAITEECYSREFSSEDSSTTDAHHEEKRPHSAACPLSVADVNRIPAAATTDRSKLYAVAATLPGGCFLSTYEADVDDADERAESEELADAVSPLQRARVLNDELLRDWTGYEDLDLVLSCELRLDAERMMGVHELGQRLPRLTALRLTRSHVPKVRLLGTRCQNLRHLWINNCKLDDLRGIGAFAPQLCELYASFNTIHDLTPLLDLSSTLETLDVEGNKIDDVAALAFVLPSLRKVTSLSIGGNGVTFKVAEVQRMLAAMQADLGITTKTAVAASTEEGVTVLADSGPRGVVALRQWLKLLMPQLESLDDVPVTPTSWTAEGENESVEEEACRPATATGRPRTSSRTVHAANAYVDPFDDALSAELRLLQDCIRESETYGDRLAENLDRKNSGIYSRPPTSCATGARQRLGSRVGSADGSHCPSAASIACSVSRLPTSANGGAHAKNATPPATAVSDLTIGSALAGSAISSLRKRLQQQHQQSPEESPDRGKSLRGGSVVVSSGSSVHSVGLREESKGTPTQRSANRGTGDDDDGGFDDTRPLLSDEDDEDEMAWHAYKARLTRPQSQLAPQQKQQVPKYRQLYQQLFLSGATAVVVAEEEERAISRGRASAAEMDSLVKKEVGRARVRIAALAAADSDSDSGRAAEVEEGVWDSRTSPAASATAATTPPQVCLHDPNVLVLSDE